MAVSGAPPLWPGLRRLGSCWLGQGDDGSLGLRLAIRRPLLIPQLGREVCRERQEALNLWTAPPDVDHPGWPDQGRRELHLAGVVETRRADGVYARDR